MQMRTKLTALALLVAALAVGGMLGSVLTDAGGRPATAAPAAGQAELASELPATAATGLTDVASLERAVAASPRDVHALTYLGYGYLQRWRETADASYLPRAATALGRAQRLAPDDALVVTGLGSLALTQHEFRRALQLGRRAQGLAPYSAGPYGIVGDALVELGRYRQAFASFEKMSALKPNVASYARIAYARELLGDVDGAVAAMGLAVDAAAGQREAGAWSRVELAKLELQRGRLAEAAHLLRDALVLLPGYVLANEQLARVDAARGRLGPAIARARLASEAVPLPQVVSLLGDLYQRDGTDSRRPQAGGDGRRDRPSARRERRPHRSRGGPVRRRPPAPRLAGSSSARRRRGHSGPRSTGTTWSRGRSPVRAAAARPVRGRSARSGSGPATRSSSSTAPGSRPASATGARPGRGRAAHSQQARTSPCAGRQMSAGWRPNPPNRSGGRHEQAAYRTPDGRSRDEEGTCSARARGGPCRSRCGGDVHRQRPVERASVESLGGAADQPGSTRRQHRPVRVRQP